MEYITIEVNMLTGVITVDTRNPPNSVVQTALQICLRSFKLEVRVTNKTEPTWHYALQWRKCSWDTMPNVDVPKSGTTALHDDGKFHTQLLISVSLLPYCYKAQNRLKYWCRSEPCTYGSPDRTRFVSTTSTNQLMLHMDITDIYAVNQRKLTYIVYTKCRVT